MNSSSGDGKLGMRNSEELCANSIVTIFSELPPKSIITETELAKIFHRHPVSIKRAVKRGELPRPIRMFGKPVWLAGSILKHIERRLEDAKKEAEKLEAENCKVDIRIP